MSTFLKVLTFAVVATITAIFFAGFGVWYWADLPGEPPYSAALILWQQGNDIHRQWLVNGTLIALGGFALLALLIAGKWYFKQRGMVYGKARLATLSEVRKAGLLGSKGIFIGYFNNRPLFDGSQQHIALIAESGTGKGVSLIIPNLFLWNGSVIVSDMKGENFTFTSGYRASRGQSCFCFDPFSTTTHRINPLSYFSEDNPIDYFQRVAYLIYPNPEGKESLWASGSRQLFIGLAILLYLEKGKQAITFANILAGLTTLDLKSLHARISALSGSAHLIDTCWKVLKDYADTPDKTRGGIASEFRSKLDIFLNPTVAWATSANDVPLEQLRKAPITLYLNTSPSNLARIRFLMSVILETVSMLHTQEEFRANPEHRFELLMLNDEQHNFYGNLPLMLNAASFYRSYGIRIFSVYQSKSYIEIDYGKDGAKAYLDNHNIRIYYCPANQNKAREFAAEIGETTIFTKSRSSSGGARTNISEAPQRREAFLPDELMKMLGSKYGLLFIGGFNPIRFRKAVWHEEKTFSSRQLPPVALPEIDKNRMERFLAEQLPSFNSKQPPDPVAALADMIKDNASEEDINNAIDAMILQNATDQPL